MLCISDCSRDEQSKEDIDCCVKVSIKRNLATLECKNRKACSIKWRHTDGKIVLSKLFGV